MIQLINKFLVEKMKIKLLSLLLVLTTSLFAQNSISELEKYSIKKLLFTNDFLNFKDDTTMLPFDIVELYTILNNSVFQLSLNANKRDVPFVLKLYGFKYGVQNGIIVTSSIGNELFQAGSVAEIYTINEVNNTITYFENLSVEKSKQSYLLSLNNEWKTIIEVIDNRRLEIDNATKKEYKIWTYVIGQSINLANSNNTIYQYRYHEFNDNDLSLLKKVLKKYFDL